MTIDSTGRVTRRTLLRASAGAAGAAATGVVHRTHPASASTSGHRPLPRPLLDLEEKIRSGMERYAIPGAAIGVWYQGSEYVRGFGVTNVDDPRPVDGDTVFRVGSTTKTFTGTAVMRLVERGLLDLDRTVRSYLPDFATSDPSVATRVTVRHLLDHSAGWLGDSLEDTGQGDDALARYVAGIADLPQLTEPGQVFAYNNAALSLAGRLIEVTTGRPYEQAIRELLSDPLGLRHSRFFTDEITAFTVAASHDVIDGKPVVEPSFYTMPRSIHPAGGLISSARDQLRYARFHLGDGRVPGGRERLLTRRSLAAMRSRPGPGGTLFVELDGMGVTWMLRPSAEGVRILQHGGDWPGQHSAFVMVPERDVAVTLLTNSVGGTALIAELFVDDWALRRLAAVSNLPATPPTLPARELARYEGWYTQQQIGPDGSLMQRQVRLVGENGQLTAWTGADVAFRLAFYRRDYVLVYNAAGAPVHSRANFISDHDGHVTWLRLGGRLLRRGPADNRARTLLTPTPRFSFLRPQV